MIITSPAHAEAVERQRGTTRYRLLGPDLHRGPESADGAAVEVSLLVLAAGTTQVLGAERSEQAFVVTSGTPDLAGTPAPAGTVVHCAPGQSTTLRSYGEPVTLLHLGGPAHLIGGPAPTAPPARVVALQEVGASPGHNPELGFFHMSAKLLVNGPSQGRRSFTVGLGTFAPGGGCHALHRHPDAEEAFYVWNGEGAHLAADGTEHPMSAGELVWAARGEWHGFRNTGSTPVHAFFCYLGVDELAKAGYEVKPPAL